MRQETTGRRFEQKSDLHRPVMLEDYSGSGVEDRPGGQRGSSEDAFCNIWQEMLPRDGRCWWTGCGIGEKEWCGDDFMVCGRARRMENSFLMGEIV